VPVEFQVLSETLLNLKCYPISSGEEGVGVLAERLVTCAVMATTVLFTCNEITGS